MAKSTAAKAQISAALGAAVTIVSAVQALLVSGHVTVSGVATVVSLAVATIVSTLGVYLTPNTLKEVEDDVSKATSVVGDVNTVAQGVVSGVKSAEEESAAKRGNL